MEIASFEHRFQSGLDLMAQLPLPQARHHYDLLCASFAPPHSSDLELIDARITGVPVRHYRPARSRSGTVLYVHGGGFTIGSLDSHQGVAEGLALALEREVVSVGYRLMPETPYAAALQDCRDVFEALGPVALVGDSAGARLILDLIADVDTAPPLGLIYPLVGFPTETALGKDAPLLSRSDVISALSLIKPDAPAVNPHQPPARQLEVLAVERDPLTAPLEQALLAWRHAGAEVNYHLAADMLHGCLHARESLPEMADAWRRFCSSLSARLL